MTVKLLSTPLCATAALAAEPTPSPVGQHVWDSAALARCSSPYKREVVADPQAQSGQAVRFTGNAGFISMHDEIRIAPGRSRFTVRLRLEKGGKGRAQIVAGGNIEHILLNTTDPWAEVEGERASLKSKHPLFSDPAVREAMNVLIDRQSIQDHIYGRTGVATRNFLNNPERFRSKNMKWEFNVDKANQLLENAGWKKGADGIRAKGNLKLKFVYQTSVSQPRQKCQATQGSRPSSENAMLMCVSQAMAARMAPPIICVK